MSTRKLILPALAAMASVPGVLGVIPVANAVPIGPCADVPYVGVCVPPSEQPTPPPQQSLGETAFIPDTTSAIHVVN
jgi:hypothetical protein